MELVGKRVLPSNYHPEKIYKILQILKEQLFSLTNSFTIQKREIIP